MRITTGRPAYPGLSASCRPLAKSGQFNYMQKQTSQINTAKLSQLDVIGFWLPLFASWLLMTAEGPIVSASINRLPREEIMLAAQGIITSLSVTIESPIINMLATATALTRDRRSYLLLRRFTIHWMVALTALTMLIAFTPFFNVVVVQWMGTPPEIAQWVRPGMQIMTLWSAAIAWRRFLQGVLIHFGQTRLVAWGTAVRLLASGGTAVGMAVWSGLPGVYVGSSALMAGVLAEAIYATIVIRPLVRTHLATDDDEAELTYRELFWFHLPLAGTSVLTLFTQPLVTTSLNRLPNPTPSLAAWPIVFQVLLMTRAAAFALPEVVIALTRNRDSYIPIRRFTLFLTAASLVGMLLLIFTPALPYYIFVIQDTTLEVGQLVETGVMVFVLLPAVTVLVSWLRGLLIGRRATRAINLGMLINLIITAVVLVLGVQMQWPGIPTAAVALTVATAAELLFLHLRANRLLNFNLFTPAQAESRVS